MMWEIAFGVYECLRWIPVNGLECLFITGNSCESLTWMSKDACR